MEEANTIKSQLSISKVKRPIADVNMLTGIGFKDVSFDLQAQNNILHLDAQDSSLFEVSAVKP